MSWKSKLQNKVNENWERGEVFTLLDVYNKLENFFESEYPQNKTVRASIRRNLQELRNDGHIEFLGNGEYKRVR